jgi:cardiolipin synthase
LDENTVGEEVYLSAIAAAGKSLYITTPYFIVDDGMVKALVNAAKSGVDVRIITPHKWDKRLVHMATRSYYRELTEGGVRVYEYSKGFIHSKTLVSDGSLSVVGTTNFDYRSLYYHFECGAVVYGAQTAAALEEDFFKVLSVSKEITEADCAGGFIRRFFSDVLRIFSPLM